MFESEQSGYFISSDSSEEPAPYRRMKIQRQNEENYEEENE